MRYAVALILCFTTLAFADDAMRTKGFVNGRYWNTGTHESRLEYLIGVREAVFLANGRTEWLSGDFTLNDYEAELNKLFGETENVNIPVIWLVKYCTDKFGGQMTKANQETALMNLRLRARDTIK
jgi:hypothetical protein